MIEVIIKHGFEELKKRVNVGTTVGDILANKDILAGVGASENCSALISARQVDTDTEVRNGDTIVLEQQAASKA